ncbi:PD40 domain-containing protein [bacterium]|nr:PD40 domain-containing protein [bacterium]
MRKHSILIAILVILAFSLGSLSLQNGYDLFQKALTKERAEGNLEEAIALYQKVMEVSKDESLAAKAQLRIGICYEKLGRKEAEKAYQKVVDNYPHQTHTVKLAKEKLSGLKEGRPVLSKESPDFSMRKVPTDIADGMGEISPDGRYLTHTDWNTGDLAVQDLKTGEKRHLTHKGSWQVSEAMAFHSRWSPDGKQIAFDWWDWSEPGFVGIRIVRPDGSNQRDLYRIEDQVERVSILYDWSPDGKNILASIWSDSGSGKIVLISVSNGSMQILKEFDSKRTRYNQINRMCFSPCGKYVIYDFPAEDSPNSNIYVLPIDEQTEIPLVEHPADDILLEWISDGNQVLFLSSRRDSLDLWRLPMDGGKAAGSPQLIMEGVGSISSQGYTKSGAFYYLTRKSAMNVFVASIDAGSGKVVEFPGIPIKHIGKSTHSPDYSADGKYLVYGAERGPAGNERTVICIRSLETGKERELYPEYNFQDFQWSPDNRYLLAVAWNKKDRTGHEFLAKIDAETGDFTQIFRCKKDRTKQSARIAIWSRDGKTIYHVFEERDNNKRSYRILARDLESGNVKELYRAPDKEHIMRVSLSRSPDGRWLAFVNEDEKKKRVINIISTSGEKSRRLYSFTDSVNWATPTEWTPEGKYVLFARSNSPENDPSYIGNRADLWRIPVDGGEPQNLDMTMFRFYQLSFHPEENYLSFSSLGPKEVKPELWMIENF